MGEEDPADKRDACSGGFRDRTKRNPSHENRDSPHAGKPLGKRTEEGKLHTTYSALELLKHRAGDAKRAGEAAAARPQQYWKGDQPAARLSEGQPARVHCAPCACEARGCSRIEIYPRNLFKMEDVCHLIL